MLSNVYIYVLVFDAILLVFHDSLQFCFLWTSKPDKKRTPRISWSNGWPTVSVWLWITMLKRRHLHHNKWNIRLISNSTEHIYKPFTVRKFIWKISSFHVNLLSFRWCTVTVLRSYQKALKITNIVKLFILSQIL